MNPKPLDLDRIERDCEAATPGVRCTGYAQFGDTKFNYLVLGNRKEHHTNWFPTKEDLNFMNRSLEDVPALVARVREMEGVIEMLTDHLEALDCLILDRAPEYYECTVAYNARKDLADFAEFKKKRVGDEA